MTSATIEMFSHDVAHVLETRMPDCEPKIVLKPLLRVCDSVGVLVERKQPALGPEPRKNRRTMPPASVRAIHVAAFFYYRQTSQHFGHKYRLMLNHGRT